MRVPFSPILGLVPALVVAFVTTGCVPKAGQEAVEHTARRIATDTASDSAPEALATQAEPENTKEAFQESLSRTLARVDAELQKLETRARDLAAEARAEWDEKLAALNAKREQARAKLDEIGAASGEAWEHLRDGAQHAWNDLEAAVKEAAAEF